MSPSPTLAVVPYASMSRGTGAPAPAAVSSAVAPLLRGPLRPLSVLAAFPQAVYVTVPGTLAGTGTVTGADTAADEVLVIVTSDGIRHPNAVVLGSGSSARPLAGLYPGQRGEVGRGSLRVGHLDVRVARWWDPRPRLRPCSPDVLAAASARSRARLDEVTDALPAALVAPLAAAAAALHADDPAAAFAAAERLLGRGPGLTPSGDDLLAGLIAGTLVLAPAVAAHRRPVATALSGAARDLGRRIAAAAPGRTTSVSAALLLHAAQGRLAAPATDLVRAWTGGDRFRVGSAGAGPQDPTRNRSDPIADPIADATDRLLAVGSSSGRDLTVGLLAAAGLVTTPAVHPTSPPPPGSPRRTP